GGATRERVRDELMAVGRGSADRGEKHARFDFAGGSGDGGNVSVERPARGHFGKTGNKLSEDHRDWEVANGDLTGSVGCKFIRTATRSAIFLKIGPATEPP